jgi:hypothetical protein
MNAVMKSLVGIATLLVIMGTIGCSGSKDSVETKSTVDLSAEGFVMAEVVHDRSKEAPCDYLLQLGDRTMLEPMALAEEFKTNGSKVWVKYSPQRRPSQCSGPTPISITDIRKRD